jgi:DNA polymerase-3 subunit epsilon
MYVHVGGKAMIKGLNFTAIDFETADAPRHTICAVGLVKVLDGEIVDNAYSLVRPPENHYGKWQVDRHRITPEMTINQPEFNVVYQQLESYFSEYPLVAHQSSFDMDCLCKALAFYEIKPPTRQPYSCSLTISRAVWPDLLSHDLKSMSHNLGIKLINHHNAIEDAEACALVVIKACEAKRAYTLDGLVQACGLEMRFIGEHNAERESSVRAATFSQKYGSLKPKNNEVIDINHPLYGRRVVVSGDIRGKQRARIAQFVVDNRGIIRNKTSSKTDYVVAPDKGFVSEDALMECSKVGEFVAGGGSISKVIKMSQLLAMKP